MDFWNFQIKINFGGTILGGLGPSALRCIWMHLDAFGCIWMHLDTFGHILTHFDTFGHIWTCLDAFGQGLDKCGQGLEEFGRCLEEFGEVWRSLKKFSNRFRVLHLNYI